MLTLMSPPLRSGYRPEARRRGHGENKTFTSEPAEAQRLAA